MSSGFIPAALDLGGRVRTLYEHNKVVSLLLSCDPALLRGDGLYHAYLARHSPALAGLPSSRDHQARGAAGWRKLTRISHQEWVLDQAAAVLRDYVADQRVALRPYLTEDFIALVLRSLTHRARLGKFQGAVLRRAGVRVLVPQDLMIPVNLVALLRTLRRGVPPRARPRAVLRGTV